jgi:hypothetical protein
MLGAVEHEAVALEPIRRTHRGDVGNRTRLRDRERTEFEFLRQRTQVCALLLLVRGDNDRQRAEVVGAKRIRDTGATVIELFLDYAGVENSEPRSAEFPGHAEVYETGGKSFLADVARKDFLIVVFAGARNNFLLAEFPRQRLKFTLLGGQVEANHCHAPLGLMSQCRLSTEIVYVNRWESTRRENRPPPRTTGNTADQNRLKPCRGTPFNA